jgi:hypothetical protein
MMICRRWASRVPDGYSEGLLWKKKTGKKNNTKESKNQFLCSEQKQCRTCLRKKKILRFLSSPSLAKGGELSEKKSGCLCACMSVWLKLSVIWCKRKNAPTKVAHIIYSIHKGTHTHKHTHSCTCTHKDARTHTSKHTHTDTHTHTHIETHHTHHTPHTWKHIRRYQNFVGSL